MKAYRSDGFFGSSDFDPVNKIEVNLLAVIFGWWVGSQCWGISNKFEMSAELFRSGQANADRSVGGFSLEASIGCSKSAAHRRSG